MMNNTFKKLLAVFLILTVCLCFFACGGEVEDLDATQPSSPAVTQPIQEETEPPVESGISPALYRVTDDDGNRIWLFGSIHVGTEDFYPLPDYVMDAYNGSDALAVELDMVAAEADLAGQVQNLQKLLYTDGSTIAQHLPEETYQKAAAILEENGLYSPLLDYYMPVMWWNTINTLTYEKAGTNSQYGIDLNLLQMAKKDGKEILEVESAEFQYDMMAGFSEPLQVMLLQGAVENYQNPSETVEDIQTLIGLWSSGDAEAFAQYFQPEEEPENEAEIALNQEYQEAMITSRNSTMTQYAEDVLLSGKEVFICVGAAHIIGEGAIAENLRQLGYAVEQIL